MIDIRVLGSGREVGRSAILIDTGTEKLLFDYGIEVQDMGVPKMPPLNLDGVFISHAHLDHSGLAPQLYAAGYEGRTFMTSATRDISYELLKDSLHVQKKKGIRPHFLPAHINVMEENTKIIENGEGVSIGKSKISLESSGHIPGSSQTILETKNDKLLYTADIKFIDTQLMSGAHTEFDDVKTIISESTYSYTDHPDRKSLEDRLREIAQETLYNNGILLLPAFAVGRTQELLLILSDLGFPIVMDGMGIEITEKILMHPDSIRDADKLASAFSEAGKARRDSQRASVLQEPCIIITTSGMMNGGPISYYMKHLHKRKDCAIVQTGFQVEGTVGRVFKDTGRYVTNGLDVNSHMKYDFLDFSAHTDRSHLIEFYKKLNPENIVLVHGDHAEDFAAELREEHGFNASAPANGEKINV
ncbi:MAG: MBL fold metallo-hydrolase [Candidatus Micrarchaeota archaeon]|nr:MBL fold metallo-hydrolase [Candidatus Micrarchaeota archaeon]